MQIIEKQQSLVIEKNGINLAVPNLSNKTPDSIIVVIATPVYTGNIATKLK